MNIEEIFAFLNEREIDYRIESNHCCGYIFYFLDGSIYPRRYYDMVLEGAKQEILVESVDHMIAKAVSMELVCDWKHRIEAESIPELFATVESYIISKGWVK